MSRPAATSWTFLILLGLIWGASFLGVEYALTGFSPLWVAAIRISLAALLILTYSLTLGPGLPSRTTPEGRKAWLHALGMAIFTNALPFTLLSLGPAAT